MHGAPRFPGGLYAWKKRRPARWSRQEKRLKHPIRRAFTGSSETYGAPRICAGLADDGVNAGRKRVARRMRELGIESGSRRGKRR
ncbi:MAG: IS3 family transposase [Actinomycetia bacterium]|nr:IS3 family transposase [Actinomycetes bacterium]